MTRIIQRAFERLTALRARRRRKYRALMRYTNAGLLKSAHRVVCELMAIDAQLALLEELLIPPTNDNGTLGDIQ